MGKRLAVAIATDVDDGDMHPAHVDAATLYARQLRIAPRPWVMVDEVHGVAVHVVAADDAGRDEKPRDEKPRDETSRDETSRHDRERHENGRDESRRDRHDQPGPGWPLAAEADVLVATRPGVPIAIWAADCAPIVLFGEAGTTVAVHAGWRGLAAGVIDVALEQLARRGERPGITVVGPVIHPCCYEFGSDDLEAVAVGVGCRPDEIVGVTTTGAPALDVPAAVRTALRRAGTTPTIVGACTGCGGPWYSHRRRADPGRHALVAWTEGAPRTAG